MVWDVHNDSLSSPAVCMRNIVLGGVIAYHNGLVQAFEYARF